MTQNSLNLLQTLEQLDTLVRNENSSLKKKDLSGTTQYVHQKNQLLKTLLDLQDCFGEDLKTNALSDDEKQKFKQGVDLLKKNLEENRQILSALHESHNRFIDICLEAIKNLKGSFSSYTKSGTPMIKQTSINPIVLNRTI